MIEPINEPRLKPLKWATSDGGNYHYANNPFGYYSVRQERTDFIWGYCFDEYYDEHWEDCESVEQGKVLAWNHWVQRIGPSLIDQGEL